VGSRSSLENIFQSPQKRDQGMKPFIVISRIAGIAVLLGGFLCPSSAQTLNQFVLAGHRIVVPESSVPHPGRIHTNFVIVDPDSWNSSQPPSYAETPASLACVYKLVTQIKGCPIATSKNVPTGGVGAIAIVDAGDFPTAKSDLHAFSSYFGIPDADFHKVYADGKKPPVYGQQGWDLEEALDIEWAHAMAPKAKLFLVESKLCTASKCNTDPTWQVVQVASKLVAENGGGVISMSWGDAEWAQERNYDHYFTTPGVVYFAASGDGGIGYTIHPGASPNVVSVGGTYFERDNNGNFTDEYYDDNFDGGGGGISLFEPRPAYQDIIKGIVGSNRGIPDVASDFCYAAIYITSYGGWGSVCGTSWSSPTFAGIVSAAGQLKKSSQEELAMIYKEYGNSKQHKADFYDVTKSDSHCLVGWDECAGVGSPRTYKGK
jgi:subtilase family serine protease